ncbi:hypothetical protein EPUL_005471, partial [Erysiphe pulchra]
MNDVKIDHETYFVNHRYGPNVFHGILIDTRAAGISQFKAFESLFGPHKLDKTCTINVKFGIGNAPSIGSISVHTPTGHCNFHVIDANTPFLLSLLDLDKNKAYFDNLNDMIRLLKNDDCASIPVVGKFGPAFLQWGPMMATTSFLTETELRTLHRRFGHPSVPRLINLLNRAGHTDENHRRVLNKITEHCQKCQRFGSAPLRFKFTLKDADNVHFNQSIFADVLYIDGAPVLHVVDEATRFQAARFLPNMTAVTLWETLRLCWIDTYLGPPAIINHDAGTNFASADFQQYNKSLSIETKEVPIEAAQSMGIVERYHMPLRRAYEVIREELSSEKSMTQQKRPLILKMAIKAINDTAGHDRIVPTLLVFGAFPRIVKGDAPTPDIMKRAKAINKAMAEVSKIRAKRQIHEAINTRNGPSPKPIPLGSNVLVWRAHRKQWEVPCKIISTVNETATIQLPSGPTKFRSTCIKIYTSDLGEDKNQEKQNKLQLDTVSNDSHIPTPNTAATPEINPNDSPTPTSTSSIIPNNTFTPTQHATNSRLQHQRQLSARFRNDTFNLSVLMSTKIPFDFTSSRQTELGGLLSRAYTQSKTLLSRQFFVKPPAELNLSPNILLKVLRPLHGIPEAGNHWFKAYHGHHRSMLSLQRAFSDACLLFNDSAIVALQTDDTLFACNDVFKQKEQNSIKTAQFQTKNVEQLIPGCSMIFNGAKITLSNDSLSLFVSQESHCKNLSTACNKDEYIAQRARGAYIATVYQPQATFDLSQAAQTTLPTTEQMKKLNKRLMWQKSFGQNSGLNFVKLDQSKLRLIAFSDASFANNVDFSSQIGYVIILADDNHCNLLHWSSTKCKRVTRSVLASELYAMIHVFDAACVLKYTVDAITKQSMPLILCTDVTDQVIEAMGFQLND